MFAVPITGGVEVRSVRVVSTVLPFRTNNYVVEELIDWDAAPSLA
jgi:hypothetical protein